MKKNTLTDAKKDLFHFCLSITNPIILLCKFTAYAINLYQMHDIIYICIISGHRVKKYTSTDVNEDTKGII